MCSLERYIIEHYNLNDENDKETIFSLLNSVNSEAKAYKVFSCKYSASNNKFLYKIGKLVGFDFTLYRIRRKPKVRYCINCGKQLNSVNQKKFCSKKCSAEYNNPRRGKMSEKTKNKIRMTLLNDPSLTHKKLRKCIICGKEYYYKKGINTKKICSVECRKEYEKNRKQYITVDSLKRISEKARKSIQKQGDARRSKNEMLFCRLCEERFANVKHNATMFNGWDADVILTDYKVAVLWNGAWHYKQISKKTSLKQIQNRDRIKISEIKKYGYVPYIIKDMGRYSEEKVYKEFEQLKKYLEKYRGVEQLVARQSHTL